MNNPEKYLKYVDHPELASYEELVEVSEKLDEVLEGLKAFKGIDLGKLETLEGQKGEKGETGPKGETGETPIRGVHYFTQHDIDTFLKQVTPVKGKHYTDGIDGLPGKDGKDGAPGKDGKDGKDVENPLTMETILDFLNEPKNATKLKFAGGKGFGYLKDGKIDTRDERWHGSGGTATSTAQADTTVQGLSGFGTITGTLDGINTVFYLSQTPIPSTLNLYYDSQYMNQGVDYTLSGNQITYAVAPSVIPAPAPMNANYQTPITTS